MKCFVWLAVLMVLSAIDGLPTETAPNDSQQVPDARPLNSVAPDVVRTQGDQEVERRQDTGGDFEQFKYINDVERNAPEESQQVPDAVPLNSVGPDVAPTQGDQDTVERRQDTGGEFEQFQYFNDVERNAPEESQQVPDAIPLNSVGPVVVPTQGEQETVEYRPNNGRQFEQIKYLNGARNTKYNQNAQSYLQKETGSRQSQSSKTFQKKAYNVISDNKGLKSQETIFRSGDQTNTNEEYQRILASTQERGQSNTGDYRRNLRLAENHGRREENKNSFTENHSKNVNLNNGNLREIKSGFQSAQNSASRQDFSQLLRSEDEYLRNGPSKTYRKNLSALKQSNAEYQESGHQRLYNFENNGVLGQRGYPKDRLINSGYQGNTPFTHRRDSPEAPIYYNRNPPSILKQGPIEPNLRYQGNRNYNNEFGQKEVDDFGTADQRFTNQHNIGPIRPYNIDNGFSNDARYLNEGYNRNQHTSQLNFESEFEKNTKNYINKAFNYANNAKKYAKEIVDEVNKEINSKKDLKYVGNQNNGQEVKVVNSATDETKLDVQKNVETQDATQYQPNKVVPKNIEGNSNTIDEIAQFIRQNRFKGNAQNYYRNVPNLPIPSNIVNDGPRYYRPPNGRYNNPSYENHGNIIPDYGRPIIHGVNPFVSNGYTPQSIPNTGVNGAPGYMTSPSTYHEEEDLEVNNVYAPRPYQRYVPHTPIFNNHKYRKGPVYKNSYYRDGDVRVVPVNNKPNTDGTVPTTIIGAVPKDNKYLLPSISPVFVDTPEEYKQTYLPENGGTKVNKYILPSIDPVFVDTPEEYKQANPPDNGGIKNNKFILPSIDPVFVDIPEEYKQTNPPENGDIKVNKYILPSIDPVFVDTPEAYKQNENGVVNNENDKTLNPNNEGSIDAIINRKYPNRYSGPEYDIGRTSPAIVNKLTPSVDDFRKPKVVSQNDKPTLISQDVDTSNLVVNNESNPGKDTPNDIVNNEVKPKDDNKWNNAPTPVFVEQDQGIIDEKDVNKLATVTNNLSLKKGNEDSFNNGNDIIKQNTEARELNKTPTDNTNGFSLTNIEDVIKNDAGSGKLKEILPIYYTNKPVIDIVDVNDNKNKPDALLNIKSNNKPAEETDRDDKTEKKYDGNPGSLSSIIENEIVNPKKTGDDLINEKDGKTNTEPIDKPFGETDDDYLSNDDLKPDIQDVSKPDRPLNKDKIIKTLEKTVNDIPVDKKDVTATEIKKSSESTESSDDSTIISKKDKKQSKKNKAKKTIDGPDGRVTSIDINKSLSSENSELSEITTKHKKHTKRSDTKKVKSSRKSDGTSSSDEKDSDQDTESNENKKVLPIDIVGDSKPASYNSGKVKSSEKTDNSDENTDSTDAKDDDESGTGSSNVKPTEKSDEDDLSDDNDDIKPAVDSINNEINKPEKTDKDDDADRNNKTDAAQKDDKATNLEEVTLTETKKTSVSTENSEDSKSVNRKHKKHSKKTKTHKASKKSDDTNPSNDKDVTSTEIKKTVSSENTESSKITKKSHKKKHTKKRNSKKVKKSKIPVVDEPSDKKDAVKDAKGDVKPNEIGKPSEKTGDVEPTNKGNDSKTDVESKNNKDPIPSKNNDASNPSDEDKDSDEDANPSNIKQKTPSEKTEEVKPLNDKVDNDQDATNDKDKQDTKTNDNKKGVYLTRTDDNTNPSNDEEDSGKDAATSDNKQALPSKKTDLIDSNKGKKDAEPSNNNDITSIPNKIIDRKPRRKHKSKKNENATSTDNERTKSRKHKKKSRKNKTKNGSPSKIGQDNDSKPDAESGNDVGKTPKRKHKRPKKNKKLTSPKTTGDTDSKDKDDNTKEIKSTPDTQDGKPTVINDVKTKNGDETKEKEDKVKDSNSKEKDKPLNTNDDKKTEITNASDATDLEKTKTTETDTSELQKPEKRTKNKDGKKDETGQGNKDQGGDSKEVSKDESGLDSIDCENDSAEPKAENNSKENKALQESTENKKKAIITNKRLKLRKIKYKIFKKNIGNTSINSTDQTEIEESEKKHILNRPKHIKKYKVPLTLKRRIISRRTEKEVNGNIEIEAKKTHTETTEERKPQEKVKGNKNTKEDLPVSKSSEEVDCDESEE